MQKTGDYIQSQPDRRLAGVTWLTPGLFEQLAAAWLAAPKGRGHCSVHTRRAYTTALRQWQAFLRRQGADIDAATQQHARGWLAELQAAELAPATIAARLAAVSAYYEFCRREEPKITNPLRANLRRPAVQLFGKARPLSKAEVGRVLEWLAARDHTPAGMRNRALVLTYLTTGARASEVVGMRWADLRKARKGCWMWAWRGKGGKRANVLIPAVTVEALAIWGAYRAQGTPLCEYVWRPVQEQGMGNLYRSSGGAARHAEHISAANALRILRSALRGAGIEDWRSIRLHDLRHTLAITLYQETHDLAAVCKQLHHENLSTVRIYLEALQGPDDLGAVVAAALGIR